MGLRQRDDSRTASRRLGYDPVMARPKRTRIGAVLMPAVPPWTGTIPIETAVILRRGDDVSVRIEWREGCLHVELVAVDKAARPPETG
jgi:hypothetical protein